MALVAGLALVFAPPAAAQEDPWLAQVATRIDSVVKAVAVEGLSPAAHPVAGALAMGGADLVEMTLGPGQYLIVAVCDADCKDLDLVLTTADGVEIDTDVLLDATPVVTVDLSEEATLNLEVKMAGCLSGPCRYGVGLYSTN